MVADCVMRRCFQRFPLASDLRFSSHVCINKGFTLTQVVMKHDLTVSFLVRWGLNMEVQCPSCRPSQTFSFVWKFWEVKFYLYLQSQNIASLYFTLDVSAFVYLPFFS
jgi:hypothetical protein